MNKKNKNLTLNMHIGGMSLFILICFFISGFTGLIYEILWTRMIVKVIGAAPFAVSIILIIFMGGLGLGSLIAGRYIDIINDPKKYIKIYGILELMIGLYSLLIPVLLILFKPLYSVIYNNLYSYTILYGLLTFIGCSIILLFPAICMGATLPILCRFYVTSLSHIASHTGRLYGFNTFGAALGASITGFILIAQFGIYPTMGMAILFNIILGLSCIIISQKSKSIIPVTAPSNSKSGENNIVKDTKITISREKATGALIIFAVSGFCAMACEVIWTKLLGLIIGPTTYSFTIVIMVFITGLALGNVFFGWLSDKFDDLIWLLIFSQIIAAILILGTSQLLGNSQMFYSKLIFTFESNFALLNFFKIISLFAFMILPTFFLGAVFPMVSKIYTASVEVVGSSIGKAYAVNSAGAVMGAFCAGFVLIPLIGKEKSLTLIIVLQSAVSFIIGVFITFRNKEKIKMNFYSGAALLAVLILCIFYPVWNREALSFGKYHRFSEINISEEIESTGYIDALINGSKIFSDLEKGELVFYGDGIGGFVTVLKYKGAMGEIEYTMANSGKADASTRGDMKTQTLLAHLPMLLHENPDNVMVLGLASGITAGEVLYYPVKKMDVIDINRQAVQASNYFMKWNNNVLKDSRTNLIIQDGRAHLYHTDRKYDVIISEPSNPWMAGMAALFTEDFFSISRDRLNKNGILAQWIHTYQMDWKTMALIGRTFAGVFKNSILVSVEPSGAGRDYILIGFNSEHIPYKNIYKNIDYLKKSYNISMPDPELLFRLIVSEDLKNLFGDGPLNTDSNPRLEFEAPRLMYQGKETMHNLWKKIDEGKYLSDEIFEKKKSVISSIDKQIDFAEYALSIYSPFPDMVTLAIANSNQKLRFIKLLKSYCAENEINYSLLNNSDLEKTCRAEQIKTLQNKIKVMPDKSRSYAYLASLYYSEENIEKAIYSYNESLKINPREASIHNNLGYIYLKLGKNDLAIPHFIMAIKYKPNFILAIGNYAEALLKIGSIKRALAQYNRIVEMKPGLPEPYLQIAYILIQEKRFTGAVKYLNKAIEIKPDWVDALNSLAWITAVSNNPDIKNPAMSLNLALKAASLTDYKDPSVLYTLAIAYRVSNKPTESIDAAERALNIARETGQVKLYDSLNLYINTFKSQTKH